MGNETAGDKVYAFQLKMYNRYEVLKGKPVEEYNDLVQFCIDQIDYMTEEIELFVGLHKISKMNGEL